METQTHETISTHEVRPFHINVPEEDFDELRRRIAATRLPEKETVADASQGVQLATMQALARYWGDRLRLPEVRGKLKALPPFHNRDRWTGRSFHSRSFET